ncbi:CD209 antigen-like [Archocentrus centrarchus]|uniref:CD209 antigen-like n=1 Tax=Archocentrus centrarchus TaxID=63155 RepID=UPI0011E9D147|nr:CD209 antigen-like [Archocentrus centrarchus]
MEERENYVAVIFQTKANSAYEKPESTEVIYEQVKTEDKTWEAHPVITAKAPPRTRLSLVVAALVGVCLILVSVIIALSLNAAVSEHGRETVNVTTQNLQLMTERAASERRTEELTRERDRLRWTVGVILEYENFPVNKFCPQKVCRPCLDAWVLFQSSCYLFFQGQYGKSWRGWNDSREECKRHQADLVVIGSLEEQEFINNHTETYNDDKHGYWIGFSKRSPKDAWTWVDGSNTTVTYWTTHGAGYGTSCALSVPTVPPLASWSKVSCTMNNRWICERRALIKAD